MAGARNARGPRAHHRATGLLDAIVLGAAAASAFGPVLNKMADLGGFFSRGPAEVESGSHCPRAAHGGWASSRERRRGPGCRSGAASAAQRVGAAAPSAGRELATRPRDRGTARNARCRALVRTPA